MSTEVTLQQEPTLYDQWLNNATELAIPSFYLDVMQGFLHDMGEHHVGTYEHSMRVGLLAPKIGSLIPELQDLSQKPLFYAGTLHDWGKLKTPKELLSKTEDWTDEDALALKPHPVDSYTELLKIGMAFTAGIVVLHHTFQPEPYPAEVPKPEPTLPKHLVELLPIQGRAIALSDFYDASHRKNSAGHSSSEQIREKIYKANSDLSELLDKLYEQGIFS